MCYDQEKTQGVDADPRHRRDLEDKIRHDLAGATIDRSNRRPMSEEEVVAEFFRYHPPNEVTIPKFAAVKQAAKNFAEIILQNCPCGADRSVVIRLIREARMTANQAIALNGLSL